MNRRVLMVSLLLSSVVGFCSWLGRETAIGLVQPLSALPVHIGIWHSTSEDSVPFPIRQVLQADDLLSRTYEFIPGTQVQLFIAYYRTQRSGERMHSPRNCLPGSGWEPISASFIRSDMGEGRVESLNRYLVERDDHRLLVVYWYEEHHRIIADEYRGKLYLLWDSIRYSRRDGAIVRVSLPLQPGMDEDTATKIVLQFIHSASPEISRILPA